MIAALLVPSAASAEREMIDNITTPHIMLMEASTESVLYEKSAREKAFPASTTKIMTCILALENASNVDALYTCGWEAVNGFGSASSLLGLKRGYKVTIKDMLYGLMLCSGNDCGACLAVATSGSMENFIALMNQKAQEIGMTGTHYTNAHGLHNEDHYTTAYDMALLMKYALQNQDFRRIISAKSYTVQEQNGRFAKTIYTSNKLIYTKDTDTENDQYSYCIGGKTGETNWAGYCLVAAAEKNGVTLITVLLGDNNMQGGTTTYYRFRNAKLLFEYGFRQFVTYDLSVYNVTNQFNVQTIGYDYTDPNNGVITAEVDISGLTLSGAVDELAEITEASFSWTEPELNEEAIHAPVNTGDVLGTVTLLLNGEPFYTGDLVAVTGIGEKPAPTETPAPTTALEIDDKPAARRDVCDLAVSKNGGEPEYTVWYFWKDTLYAKEDKENKSYLLFFDEDVFRCAAVPAVPYELKLYKQTFDDFGLASYELAEAPEDGEAYVIVSQGYALSSQKKGRTLLAVPVEFDVNGAFSTEITEDMVWRFKANGGGFNLLSKGKYLHRAEGNGLLFWILIAILVIGLAIVIRLLVTSRTRRRNPKMRGKYKIYKM